MDHDRQEVYERIPWETLERKGGDRQWIVYAVAGAVTLGALAYSFTRNQPVAPQASPVASTAPASPPMSNTDSPPSTVASPIVVAEADLYAVEPERLIDRASAHAEWFAVEYMALDRSDESRRLLASLLPAGTPLPEAPEGLQVYVDWVRTVRVTPSGPVSYQVEVLVRSLVSDPEGGFVRQPPMLVGVEIEIGDDGEAHLAGVPSISAAQVTAAPELALVPVPDEVLAEAQLEGEVLGGVRSSDGTWEIVVMADGPDGVRRPVTIRP